MNCFTVRRSFFGASRRQRDLARGSGVGRLQQRSPWSPARFLHRRLAVPRLPRLPTRGTGRLSPSDAHTHPADMFVVTEHRDMKDEHQRDPLDVRLEAAGEPAVFLAGRGGSSGIRSNCASTCTRAFAMAQRSL